MRDNRHELWEAGNGRERPTQARLPEAHGSRLGPPLPRCRDQPVQMNTQSARMRRPRKSPPLRQASPASRAQSRALWTPAARSAADTRRCGPRTAKLSRIDRNARRGMPAPLTVRARTIDRHEDRCDPTPDYASCFSRRASRLSAERDDRSISSTYTLLGTTRASCRERRPPARLVGFAGGLRVRHVFSRPRKRRSAPDAGSTSQPISEASSRTVQPQSEPLQDWRRSAQRVTRAWNSWLAADHPDRRDRYLAYVSALADEELRATEVQRLIQPTDTNECAIPNR